MVVATGAALLFLGYCLRFSEGGYGVAGGAYNTLGTAALYFGGILFAFGLAYCIPRWAQIRQEQAQLESARMDAPEEAGPIVIDLRTPVQSRPEPARDRRA